MRGDPWKHPDRTWGGEPRLQREPGGAGLPPGAPTGRGWARGPMGRVCAGGGVGSGPGIPVAASGFSGTRAPSASSRPLPLSGITPERLRPPVGE